MPRRTRLFIPGGIYHVYNRITRGERVFESQSEAENWIDVVASESRLNEIKILAWCLMSNHYHLVVKTGSLPLWRAMARTQARISREYNQRRRVRGPLWQSRYKARLVREQEDLQNLLAYVHLNPVTAGMVSDPADYQRSGHRSLIGLDQPLLVDVRESLLVFNEVAVVGRALYQARLRLVAETSWCKAGVRHLPWWRTVDDNELTLANEKPPQEAITFEGRPLPDEIDHRPPLALVLSHFEASNSMFCGRLSGKSRTRLDSWFRCLFSTFAVCWLGFSVSEVARVLAKAPGSVSRWLADGLELQQSNDTFRAILLRLRREIESHVISEDQSLTPWDRTM